MKRIILICVFIITACSSVSPEVWISQGVEESIDGIKLGDGKKLIKIASKANLYKAYIEGDFAVSFMKASSCENGSSTIGSIFSLIYVDTEQLNKEFVTVYRNQFFGKYKSKRLQNLEDIASFYRDKRDEYFNTISIDSLVSSQELENYNYYVTVKEKALKSGSENCVYIQLSNMGHMLKYQPFQLNLNESKN